MNPFYKPVSFGVLALLLFCQACRTVGTVYIEIPPHAAPRVQAGAEKIAQALRSTGSQVRITTEHLSTQSIHGRLVDLMVDEALPKEGYEVVVGCMDAVAVVGGDDSGLLYASMDLSEQIHLQGGLPLKLKLKNSPAMTLRGTCIGMQKTYILPGRKVYEYPYTPELFPWFYDQKLWTEYLDFLAANRMNTLYLWSGHPFASLVRLKDYPYAVEVPDDVFQKNQQQFRWLAQECDKRGIWLVQMFYNIFVSKPFAETNGISTQLSAPTPLASDYTRKSIAEFVKEFPNVGLMMCLGEALQGTSNQVAWATQTVLPGVLDGMKAAGLKEQPPVVIRTHAMNPEAIMPACFQVYSNLFTETKYNGESLTTWEPRGKGQATHQAMSKLGPHLVNIHILSNLEPFRYGDTEFIRKSVLASRDRFGASGIHLYPLTYWNWPYSPDIADPPLLQWNRDWIWFEAWSRYAWNPDLPEKGERAYWISRLADVYGNTNAAEKILDAYNAAGEIAPRLVRRFGITEGNRQTLSLGMTLDELVNPNRYGAIEDLWLSQAPPGERLDEYVRKEWNHTPHTGETPVSIQSDVLAESSAAVAAIDTAAGLVTKNRAEFERFRNDVHCLQLLAENYVQKTTAALSVLRYGYSKDIADMRAAEASLAASFAAYQQLAARTDTTYNFANSMQTSQRKIPVSGGVGGKGTNYLWSQLVPLYQKELEDFQARVVQLKLETNQVVNIDESSIKPWPAARFKLISTNAETYSVEAGAKVFTDRDFTLRDVAPELRGLTGIRFSHESAKAGLPAIAFEAAEPLSVLVGYFNSNQKAWLQVPKLEFAAQADERGGVDTVIENAAEISGCPGVNIHAFRFEPGRQQLELIGKGSFVILGVVPQSAQLQKRDAHFGGTHP